MRKLCQRAGFTLRYEDAGMLRAELDVRANG
jgi:hypothetical protein